MTEHIPSRATKHMNLRAERSIAIVPTSRLRVVFQKLGWPSGNERTAKAGWSGHTKYTRNGILGLLSNAVAEAAAQQGK